MKTDNVDAMNLRASKMEDQLDKELNVDFIGKDDFENPSKGIQRNEAEYIYIFLQSHLPDPCVGIRSWLVKFKFPGPGPEAAVEFTLIQTIFSFQQ